MHDGRDLVPPLRTYRFGDQHVGRILLAFEYLRHALRQHEWRKRPERLPMLDAAVEDVLHFGLARICNQTAVAEGTRAEFGTILKPADHLLVGQQLRGI